jgi:hypothetical protein
MGDVFARSRARGTARLVLLALADVAHDTGEVAAYRRSHRVLAAKANVAERSVTRAIAELVELGELVVVERGDGRRQSDYQIVVPAVRGVTDCHPSDGGSRGDRLSPQGCQVVTPAPTDCHPRGDTVVTPIITSLSIPDVSTPPPAARGRADRPKPSPEARAVARAVWDQRQPKPATPFVAFPPIVDRLREAGWSDDAITAAAIAAPTLSTKALEVQLARGKARAPKIDTARDVPSGMVDQW